MRLVLWAACGCSISFLTKLYSTHPCAWRFGWPAAMQICSQQICRTEGFESSPPGAPIKNPPEEVGCLLVRPEGFEPPTTWFEARYSIQLSYGRITGITNSFCLRRRTRFGANSLLSHRRSIQLSYGRITGITNSFCLRRRTRFGANSLLSHRRSI
jgi:hypothetical protein